MLRSGRSGLHASLVGGLTVALAAAIPASVQGASDESARPAAADKTVIGRSVRGRPIHAYRVGGARRKVLVFGLIHGNESAGIPVARRLRRMRPPRGIELLLVDDLNPDGHAAGRRQNARGVDLNRNFPRRWRLMGRPFSK